MAISPVVVLAVRSLTFVCLLVSLILITTNTITLPSSDYDWGWGSNIKFNDIYAFRYLVATLILGLAYTLLQTVFAVIQACTGKRVGGERFCVFDFFGDKVVSYLLVTGAAASFAMTRELKDANTDDGMDKFANKASVAARLCLVGFLFAATSSVFSSYALPKRA
ncbi:PREDICTED: CASP-like protein PIMP1 [Ipomoea nil]|uniref:CASP-like protein PIMP1 n=1 Tax=Ipomoea nil TaxID=35883 RepID=UPI00090200A1|nr:PREDICTED: CASP-like protein PIMP1 [Ipomoea nil]